MSPDEMDQVETILSQSAEISRFFGDWISEEMEKARQSHPYHILLGYLASPYGYCFAARIAGMLDTVSTHIPNQCPRLRKKIIEKRDQSQFEAVLFELEVGSRLLEHGHDITIEPLGNGPDLRVQLPGYEVYIEVKKLQQDAETRRLWKTPGGWTRVHTQSSRDNREWDLHGRYLMKSRFPDDGLHILIIDTSKRPRADRLLARAWKRYCQKLEWREYSQPPIHSLILCHRQDQQHISWLCDLAVGAVVMHNTNSSLPNGVLEVFAGIFK